MDSIGPYLNVGSAKIVQKASVPLGPQAKMLRGNMPTDGGNFILSREEYIAISSNELIPDYFIRPFMGAAEVAKGNLRYCVWIKDSNLESARNNQYIAARIQAVKAMRLDSKSPTTRATKVPPHRFMQIEGTSDQYAIAIPAITSVNRDYLPVTLVDSKVILSNKCYALYDAPIWNLSIAASKIHQLWIGTVCARMRFDYSYSNTLGWNTFPVPTLTEKNKLDLTRCAEDILLAREKHFPETIAELYDHTKPMHDNLRQAHEKNDETLERIYIGRRFNNDTERLEKLFELYTKMTSSTTSNKMESAS